MTKKRWYYDLYEGKWARVPTGMKFMKRWIELGFIPELTDLRPYWEAIKITNQGKHISRVMTKLARLQGQGSMLPEEGRIVTAWNRTSYRYLTGIVQHWRNHDLWGFRLIGDTGKSIGAFYDDDEWKYVDEPKGGV